MNASRSVKFALAALMASSVSVASAAPIVIQTVSDDFGVVWNHLPTPAPATGFTLKADATFDVTSVSNTQLVLSINVTNTLDTFSGPTPTGYNGGLTSIGFSVDPNATAVSFSQQTGGTEDFGAAALDSIPSLALVEICAWTANNCNGGGQGNLLDEGASDNFQLTLTRNAAEGAWTLNDFGIKIQTSYGSYEFYGEGRIPPDEVIPEPAPIALMGLALAGIALARRRGKAKQAA